MTAHEVPNSHHVSFLPCSQWVLKELTWSVLTEKFATENQLFKNDFVNLAAVYERMRIIWGLELF